MVSATPRSFDFPFDGFSTVPSAFLANRVFSGGRSRGGFLGWARCSKTLTRGYQAYWCFSSRRATDSKIRTPAKGKSRRSDQGRENQAKPRKDPKYFFPRAVNPLQPKWIYRPRGLSYKPQAEESRRSHRGREKTANPRNARKRGQKRRISAENGEVPPSFWGVGQKK